MKLNDAQLVELERIREWACCLEPERRFMAEAETATLKRELRLLRTSFRYYGRQFAQEVNRIDALLTEQVT